MVLFYHTIFDLGLIKLIPNNTNIAQIQQILSHILIHTYINHIFAKILCLKNSPILHQSNRLIMLPYILDHSKDLSIFLVIHGHINHLIQIN
mmetsp:Transcript_40781/g.36200  ORF Transcript_40781/g.36200 Transcript_40781/m.36200 type:complete len:92 (-) Transcript_40781:1856-2131(-)